MFPCLNASWQWNMPYLFRILKLRSYWPIGLHFANEESLCYSFDVIIPAAKDTANKLATYNEECNVISTATFPLEAGLWVSRNEPSALEVFQEPCKSLESSIAERCTINPFSANGYMLPLGKIKILTEAGPYSGNLSLVSIKVQECLNEFDRAVCRTAIIAHSSAQCLWRNSVLVLKIGRYVTRLRGDGVTGSVLSHSPQFPTYSLDSPLFQHYGLLMEDCSSEVALRSEVLSHQNRVK